MTSTVGTTTDLVLSADHIDVTVVPDSKRLFGRATPIKIIDDVSVALERNRTYGLVGESGSGKSTLGRALIGVQEGVEGDVVLEGVDLPAANRELETRVRRTVQMIFQDPLGAFDPRQTVRESMLEALSVHELRDEHSQDHLEEQMHTVGLPVSALDVSPRRLSGGQRQRAVIARAISLEPSLIIADEPFAALDVTTQARVVAVMARLQHERGLTQLIISHDLSLIDLICDEVLVMYLGSIVESGPSDALAESPAHPYTLALRSAIPVPNPVEQRMRERILLPGDPPVPAARPSGCSFHPRCPMAQSRCAVERPELRDIGEGRMAACHYAEQVIAEGLTHQTKEAVDERRPNDA